MSTVAKFLCFVFYHLVIVIVLFKVPQVATVFGNICINPPPGRVLNTCIMHLIIHLALFNHCAAVTGAAAACVTKSQSRSTSSD